jgi:multicomponent Na+:H+ antiporter subunit D
MNNILIALPLLIPFSIGILTLFLWKKPHVQLIVYSLGCLLMLGAAGSLLYTCASGRILSMRVGGFDAPYAITLVCDIFSALMLVAASLLALLVSFFVTNDATVDRQTLKSGFFSLLLFMFFGINGSLLTADLFNLYVWFEVMLVSSFVLITLGGKRAQLEGGIKYVTINFLASAMLLAGTGVVYGLTGSTNMAQVSVIMEQEIESPLIMISGLFFLLSLGIKSAIFPLFFWLPASYHTPSISVTAVIAGLLTKIGIYALIRVFTVIIPFEGSILQYLLLVLAGFTMLVGVLGAVAQYEMRKLLSFHIISQIGYMVMGLAINTPLALGGAVFFIIHNILVKSNLFFISGLVFRQEGTTRLKKLGGYYRAAPFVALLFFLTAFSLAGVPPLSGFWGKYFLALGGLEAEFFVVVGISLFTGLLTLFSMAKIWRYVFLRQKPEEETENAQGSFRKPHSRPFGMYISIASLVVVILLLSLYPEPVARLSREAGEQLFHHQNYVETILNTK